MEEPVVVRVEIPTEWVALSLKMGGGKLNGFSKSASDVLLRYGFKSAGDEFKEIVESTMINPDRTGGRVTSKDAAIRLPNGNILVADYVYNSLSEWKRNTKRDGTLSSYSLKSTAGGDGYKHSAKELENYLKYWKIKPI